jgi:predicted nucleotidyltransferase
MRNEYQRIIRAVEEKAEALCPDSLALIGVYGSCATGDVHPRSDLDLLILIRDEKGRALADAFILEDLQGETIGFDLYCRLLKKEIARMQGLAVPQEEIENSAAEVDVNIEFLQTALSTPPEIMAAALPREYIENEHLRISAYRQLSGISSEARLEAFKEELIDRYGRLPETAANLLELFRCRILVAAGNFRKLNVANNLISLTGSGGKIYRENGS